MAKKTAIAKVPTWLIGTIITGLFLFSFVFKGSVGILNDFELKSYDFRMKMFSPTLESDRIAIVAIDSESISKLGRWPWSRDKIATVITKLSSDEYNAKVIGLNILFTEPEESTGLKLLNSTRQVFFDLGLDSTRKGKEYLAILSEQEANLNNDTKLLEAVREAGNVVLPMAFGFEQNLNFEDSAEMAEHVVKNAATQVIPMDGNIFYAPVVGQSMLSPLEELAKASDAMGHLNKFPGRYDDGIDRWESLLIEYGGEVFPSYALAIAARYKGIAIGDLEADLGGSDSGGIAMKDHVIETDDMFGSLINYYNREESFPVYSFFDIYNDKISPGAFKNKIVLIGITDVGLGDASPTPVSPVFSAVEREATVIENILSLNTIKEPWWSPLATLITIIAFGVISTLTIVRMSAKKSSVVNMVLLVSYVGAVFYFFSSQHLWIDLTHPTLLMLFNYIAISSKKFYATEEEKDSAVGESDEANKLLGLTFQSKGMLEMAFEKFKKMHVDEEIRGILYNLAMDFEKKRNWTQALDAYERIKDGKFKDTEARLEKVNAIISGTGGAAVNLRGDAATIISEGGEMPTLGRYEIVRELGRGAMGVVYEGKDPKINRSVAIKTVNLDEIEEKQVGQIKERFFREAQSAGTLNHPNIMTIFDVGEDGNLAYIAMEMIDGRDLEHWCKKENLLKVKDTLMVIAKVAEALDFAHSNGIIHRDIKPGNIMVTKKGDIKVADFGIARIQSSSATKTGTVLGTPSYMSPEQVAGKKADGRADVFSLGVVLYEMLTSERPFTGDSIATIMYNITNSPPTPLKDYNPELPEFCQALIDKALARDLDKRFQKAGEFAAAIKWCMQKYESEL